MASNGPEPIEISDFFLLLLLSSSTSHLLFVFQPLQLQSNHVQVSPMSLILFSLLQVHPSPTHSLPFVMINMLAPVLSFREDMTGRYPHYTLVGVPDYSILLPLLSCRDGYLGECC